MKKFFKEYGAVTIAIFALLVLIAIITPVGNIIKTSLQGTTSKFAAGMNSQTDDALNATLALQEDIKKVPIAETIYWGIDDTGKLTISDQEVGGDYSGNFRRTTNLRYSRPWNNYKNDIKSVEVVKVSDEIMPTNLEYWFFGLKNCSYFDLRDLNTSEATSMENLFGYAGENVSSFKIEGLDNWNVSNTTNMFDMFLDTGYNATDWNIGDLSNWDVSNVENMQQFMSSAGYNAADWNIGDLSSWNTEKVTNMTNMFMRAGYKASHWHIGDISDWNISNVTSILQMFMQAGGKSTDWNIGDISKWDTSNVTNMYQTFANTASYTNYSLDLSSWDVDKVTDHRNFNAGTQSKVIPPVWVN